MIYALVIVAASRSTPRPRQLSLLTARSRRQKAWPCMKLAHALRTHPVPALAALALLAGPTVPPITRTGPKNTRGTRHDYAFRFVLFFVAFVSIGLPKGQTFATGQNTPTGRTIPVPVGKRLVIQMVSVWRSGTLTPGEGVRAYVGCMVNGHEIFTPCLSHRRTGRPSPARCRP